MNNQLKIFIAPVVSPLISFLCIFLIGNLAQKNEILEFYTSLALIQLLFTCFIWGNGVLLYREYFGDEYEIKLISALHFALIVLFILLILSSVISLSFQMELIAAFMLCLHRLIFIDLRLREEANMLISIELINSILFPILIIVFYYYRLNLIFILLLKDLFPAMLFLIKYLRYEGCYKILKISFYTLITNIRSGIYVVLGTIFNRGSRYLDRKVISIFPIVYSSSEQILSLQIASTILFFIAVFGDYLTPITQRYFNNEYTSRSIINILMPIMLLIFGACIILLLAMHVTIESFSLLITTDNFWLNLITYGLAFAFYVVNLMLNPLLVMMGHLKLTMYYHASAFCIYILSLSVLYYLDEMLAIYLPLALLMSSFLTGVGLLVSTYIYATIHDAKFRKDKKLTMKQVITGF